MNREKSRQIGGHWDPENGWMDYLRKRQIQFLKGNESKGYFGFETSRFLNLMVRKWGSSILIIFYPFNEGAQLVGTGKENYGESEVNEIVTASPFLNICTDAGLSRTGGEMRILSDNHCFNSLSTNYQRDYLLKYSPLFVRYFWSGNWSIQRKVWIPWRSLPQETSDFSLILLVPLFSKQY